MGILTVAEKQALVLTDCQTQKNMKRLAGTRSVWMRMKQICVVKSMIWKFRDRTRELTRTGQDIVPVQGILKIVEIRRLENPCI